MFQATQQDDLLATRQADDASSSPVRKAGTRPIDIAPAGAGRRPVIMLVGETRGLVSRVAWSLPTELYSRHCLVGPESLGPLKFARRCAGHIVTDLQAGGAAAFIAAARALLDTGQMVIAFPADEAGAAFLCRHRVAGLIRAPHPDQDILADLCNKWTFFDICMRLGIKTPNTTMVADKRLIDLPALSDQFRFPLIVKPVTGTNSRGCMIVRSEHHLRTAIIENPAWNFGPLLIQDFIEGSDIHISAFSINGAIQNYAVHMRDRNGALFLRDHALLEAARVMLKGCDYTGLANIDARVAADGAIHVLECNPRPWGSIHSPTWCGLNFVRASLTFAMGRVGNIPRSIADCYAPAPWRRVKAILKNPLSWTRLTADQKRTLWSAAWLQLLDIQDRWRGVTDGWRRRPRRPGMRSAAAPQWPH